MRLPSCFVLALFLMIEPAAGQVPPPPPPPPAPAGQPRDAVSPAKTGTAVLSGRVTSAQNGRPLRRAQVRAVAPELREGRSISTDDQGRWQLKALPAGRYSIIVSKGGYVTLSYGQRRPFEQGKPVDVAAGQVIDKLDVVLPKGGVVTGRAVDEYGEPLTGARVSALRYRFVGGQRRLMTAGASDLTDDIGEYRLHGLSPGEYYISATLSGMTLSLEKSDDRTSYVTTYFPGTPILGDAQRVSVLQGQEAQGVSFSLAPRRVATVSGIVVSSNGRPVSSGMVMLTAPAAVTGENQVGGAAMVKPDGTFLFSHVAPGEYVLQIQSVQNLEVMAASGSSGINVAEVASLPLRVTGADVQDVILVTAPTAVAKGRVVFDPAVPPNTPAASLSIFAASTAPDVLTIGTGSGRVRDDWTFEASGLSGRRMLRISAPPGGWWLKSVTLNGADVTDTGIDFTPGETVTGIEVVLTRNMGSLAGSVQNANGHPASDYVFVAYAADSAKWGYQTRFVRAGRPDQSGRFLLTGLPAEEYLVAAVEYLEPGEESDPELLEGLRAQATPVRVGDGERKTVMLKMK